MKEWNETKDSPPSQGMPVIVFNGNEKAHAVMKGDRWYLMNTYPEIWIDKGLPTHWMEMPDNPITQK